MRRRLDARKMEQGLSMMRDLRSKLDPDGEAVARNMPGMSHLFPEPAPAPAQPAPEMAHGHCVNCTREGREQASHDFQVEGTEPMPNGAVRKHGKCPNGHKISTFAPGSGAKKEVAA